VIVFLDIDGVLLPIGLESAERLFPEYTLDALAHILTQIPNAELVLSSTWRVQESFIQAIVDDFKASGKSPLDQVTFTDITDPTMHTERQHEILEWLTRHGYLQQHQQQQHQEVAWIAIDDEELLEGPPNAKHRHLFEHHVIKTDSHIGITMEDARQAVKLLHHQITYSAQETQRL
jgi:ribosomal protein S8